MRPSLVCFLSILCSVAAPVQAQGKSCEQLRDEIASRLTWPQGSYRLDIVPKDDVGEAKILGSCERGARRIVVYRDGAAPAAAAAALPASAPAEVLAEPADPQASAPLAATPPSPTASAVARARARRGAVDEATLDQYREWIAQARTEHPYADSEDRMFDVMMCESKGNASLVARAGPYSGLFQYATGTWKAAWNTYSEQDILDAKTQIFATALAWKNKMQRQWGCYKKQH